MNQWYVKIEFAGGSVIEGTYNSKKKTAEKVFKELTSVKKGFFRKNHWKMIEFEEEKNKSCHLINPTHIVEVDIFQNKEKYQEIVKRQ